MSRKPCEVCGHTAPSVFVVAIEVGCDQDHGEDRAHRLCEGCHDLLLRFSRDPREPKRPRCPESIDDETRTMAVLRREETP